MKYYISNVFAQAELREIQIEANSLKEAEEKARAWREEDDFFENKHYLGDIERDTLEINDGEETTIIELGGLV